MRKLFSFLLFGAMLVGFSACEPNEPNKDSDSDVTNNDSTTTQPTTGTHNGHDWVDLGLPSGTLWATCNVGATKLEDYGDYFAWGEIAPKETYNWSTYKYGDDFSELTKYCTSSYDGKDGFTDGKTVLDPEDDAATVNWGGDWRMPTAVELQELRTECTWTWTTLNDVNGYEVNGKNGNSIFLPAARYLNSSESFGVVGMSGAYWSSSLPESEPNSAYYLHFWYDESHEWYYSYRYLGFSVRPVCSPR